MADRNTNNKTNHIMKSINIIIGILLVIGLQTYAIGQDQDAYYEKYIREYTLNEDGSSDLHVYTELKILSHYVFQRRFGESFIVYNPEFQQVKINASHTIMADGSKVVTPENAYNELLPRWATGSAYYNHLRELVVTHTGLEVGSTVFLDYTVHSTAEFMPFLMGNESLQEPVGIKDLQIIVKIPETMELQHQVYNLRTGAEEELSDGQKIFTWTFRELKPNYNEAFQNDDKAPRLVFSTSTDMERSFFAFVNQNAFRHKLNDGIKGVVKKIVEENKTDLEIMKALQKVVVNDVKLINVDAKYTGFRCRTPKQVWESGNATELEKSILLSDMLIEAGINAFPLGAIRSRFYDKEKANLLLFDHYYVQVNPKKADRQYLSVTSMQEQNMLYVMNKVILVQLDGAIERMRTFNEKPIVSGIGIEGEIVILDTNLAEGKFELTLEGAVNPFYNLFKDSALVKKYINTGNVLKTETANINRLTESKTTAEFLTKGETLKNFEGYYFFELPHISGGIDKWHLEGISSTRETPMELPYPIYESISYKVIKPEGSRLLTRPIKLEIKNVIGQVSVLLTVKDEEVKLVRQLKIDQVMVEPHQYGYLLQLLEAYHNKNYAKLIFTFDE